MSLSLEQYAKLGVLLRGVADDRIGAVLQEHGVSPKAWEDGKAHWTRELERDAEGDGDLLVRWAALRDAALRDPTSAAAPPARVETPPLPAGPAAPVGHAKPSFLVQRQAQAAAGAGPSPWAMPTATPAATPAPKPMFEEGETRALDASAILHDSLPFEDVDGGSGTVVLAPAETKALMGDAKPAPVPPSSVAATAGGTVELKDFKSLRAALPFPSKSKRPQAEPPPPSAPHDRAQPSAPPSAQAPPSAPIAGSELTVEQYASLHAELHVHPHRGRDARARYGVADDQRWLRVQQTFNDCFQRDRALYARWYELYMRYRAWFAAQPPR